MIKMKTAAMVLGLSLSGHSLACSMNGKDGLLPENDMYIPVGYKSVNGGLTEAQFNSAIDKVESVFESIVASHGGKLSIDRKWTDGTVNAYATQTGKNWKVFMFGGLARHETITEDGMNLVVCHELGHHLGGAPKIGGSASGGGWWGGSSSGTSQWASNEGQADYFATLKCLRKVYLNDDNAKIVAGLSAPKSLIDACTTQNKGDKAETAMCIRMGMAGKSVANLFSVLSNLPDTKFESPDKAVVSKTDDAHPKAQCRLDTYFQGALCDSNMNQDVSNTDEMVATCNTADGHKIGVRPLCWFKPSKN
jgi:hypothetical protein